MVLGQQGGDLSAQVGLAVVGDGIGLVAGVGDNRVDGAGQLAVPVKLCVDGLVVVVLVVGIRHQDVIHGDDVGLAGGGALDHHRVLLTVVFGQGRGIGYRVHLVLGQVVGQGGVQVQEVAETVVDVGVRRHHSDGHILVQGFQVLPGGI